MARRTVGMGLGVLAAVSAVHGCKSLQVAHSGDNPRYALIGKHLAVPCEGCHGPGKPEAQSRLCMDCHAAALPSAAHYPGQECGSCHTPLGWDVVDTTVPPDSTPDPGTGDTGHEPGWVHDPVGPKELCWDCHDEDRPTGHYWSADITFRWDCASCHTLLTWSDDPRTPELDTATTYEHGARTPHGMRNNQNPIGDQTQWVISCDTCHPAVLTQFDCVNCHLERDSSLFPHYNASNDDCLGCHPDGDYVFVPQ